MNDYIQRHLGLPLVSRSSKQRRIIDLLAKYNLKTLIFVRLVAM